MSLYQNRMVDSFDGTTIAYQVVSKNGPPMVLSNGLGGNIVTWKHLIDHFRDRYAILSWDYRGLYSSGVPNDPHALSVTDQSRDLFEVMKRENIDQAILVGWSMGVQVNFEFYRLYPEKVSAIIIINGTYGRPFDTAFSKGFMKYVLPVVAKVMQRCTNYILPLAPLVVRSRQLPRLVKMTGLVAESLDESVFYDLAQDYIHMDFWYYWETFRQMGDHDAGDLLGKMRIPVLKTSTPKN